MTLEDAPSRLDGQRPASKLVYLVLREQGPLSSPDLAEMTRLSPARVRQEAGRLQDAGLVETRPSTSDPRGLMYEAME